MMSSDQTLHVPEIQHLDLSTEQGVRTYLAETPYRSTDIETLSGGTANYVFRLRLITPYNGRETLVFKHAKPYVKNAPEFPFLVDRQTYEVEALRRVRAWLAPDSVVIVPEVHLFDDHAHVIVMDDSGINSLSLKAFMQQGLPSVDMARQIGDAIGTFLGGLHKWGRCNEELCKAIRGNNVQARPLSAWVFYGRLKETLTGAKSVPMLSDPPLDVSRNDLEVIDRVVEETTKAILAEENIFVQGDFWPGNLMVALDDNNNLRHIYVLDWELCKTGLPGIDVGQFSAEIHLLRRFHADICGETATALLDHFLSEYKRSGDASSEDMTRATVQVGTHLAVLAGRVPWGSKELTREVVLEGMRMVVDGSNMLAGML